MTTESEVGVMQLTATEQQGLPASTRSQERGMEHILPQTLKRNPPKDTWISHVWPPELLF